MAVTKRILALALVLFIGFAAGCGPATAPAEHDLAMAAMSDMPHEVQQASARVQEAYQFAFANPEILGQIPCYCGCGGLGHKSNYDCYVAGQDEAGRFIYDPHALGCLICVDITQDSMRLVRAATSPGEIRAYIDMTFARYGPSNMPTEP